MGFLESVVRLTPQSPSRYSQKIVAKALKIGPVDPAVSKSLFSDVASDASPPVSG